MKYIKLIILALFLSTMFTGCSYVSDTVEGRLTDRASFTATAVYNGSSVNLTWDNTDFSDNFAGIEIYRTFKKNDEYSQYDLVASKYYGSGSGLNSGNTINFTDSSLTTYHNPTPASNPESKGVYFYRVAFYHWDQDTDEREYSTDESNYYIHTDIDEVSGNARVVIPNP
jgi:hypothetical protein